MGKSTKKDAKIEDNAESRESQRLRKLALDRKIISSRRVNFPKNHALPPSRAILRHNGTDIIKKAQRKNRYLFAFPCLLAPVSSGKMGELTHLDTKNPILYVDFPQGRMKFFGTIIYPKNKCLSLQVPRGAGSVVCEDSFESIVVFSDVWWIGRKEENPEELQLEFPKELNQEKHAEFHFKGGAGGVSGFKSIGGNKLPLKECDEPLSPETHVKSEGLQASEHIIAHSVKWDVDNLEEESKKTPLQSSARTAGKTLEEEPQITPVRSSARTAGKTFKFADSPSDDDLGNTGSDTDSSDPEHTPNTKKRKVNQNLGNTNMRRKLNLETPQSGIASPRAMTLGEGSVEGCTPVIPDTEQDRKKIGLHEVHNSSTSARKTVSQKKSKETGTKSATAATTGVLVQSSLSPFLSKSEDKKTQKGGKTPSQTKGSAQRRRSTDLKGKDNQIKDIEEEKSSEDDVVEIVHAERRQSGRIRSGRGKSVSEGKQAKTQTKHESSDIEGSSNETEVNDDSDEDWTG